MGAIVTAKAYMLGWIAYLLGSAGVLFVLWYISRPLVRWLKLPLRAIAAALLLTPWSVSPDISQLAPAWVVSLFDGFAQNDISLWRAGGPLLAMVIVALLVACAEMWRQRRKERGRVVSDGVAGRAGEDFSLPAGNPLGGQHRRERY